VAASRARADVMALSVLGGGREWAGRALMDGAQVIDLPGMRQVKVDGDLATVSGGATANDLIAAAAGSGMSAATGTVGAVGHGRADLGRGYGPLNGIAGLAADNLSARRSSSPTARSSRPARPASLICSGRCAAAAGTSASPPL
jgi:hypothetical protein